MAEIEGVDPLTTGKTMYDEEDIKASSRNRLIDAEPDHPGNQAPAPIKPNKSNKFPNQSKSEQEKVAKGRTE